MSQVRVQEILDTLTDAIDLCLPEGEPYALTTYEVLRGRIEAHGIAPPEGSVLVSEQDVHNQAAWLVYLEHWIGSAAIHVLRDRYNAEHPL